MAHNEEDRVQIVINYVSVDAADMLYDWFVNYAGINSAFIDLAAWKTETGRSSISSTRARSRSRLPLKILPRRSSSKPLSSFGGTISNSS